MREKIMWSYEYWKKQQPIISVIEEAAVKWGVEKEFRECLLKEYSTYQMKFVHP